MKTILFATDFSKSAYNSIDYALATAQAMEARLILLYVRSPSSPLDTVIDDKEDSDLVTMKKEDTRLLLFHDMMMIKYKTDFFQKPFPEFKPEKQNGKVAETILDVAKKENADLIIMGDNTVNTFLGNLIVESSGTHSSYVAVQAECPVLLIPPLANYKPIKHIMYGVELKDQEVKLLHEVMKFVSLFNADLEIIHIDDRESIEVKNNIQMELEKEFKNFKNISFKKITKDDVIKGLNTYVKNQKPDLLILVNRQRPYEESFYHESMSEHFAFGTEVPVLILHQ